MYTFIARDADLCQTLGFDLVCEDRIFVSLIAAPAGAQWLGDSVALALCSRWGGSRENRTPEFHFCICYPRVF